MYFEQYHKYAFSPYFTARKTVTLAVCVNLALRKPFDKIHMQKINLLHVPVQVTHMDGHQA